MIRLDARHLLFIAPRGLGTAEPLIDEYTRRMAGALRVARLAPRKLWKRGFHTCVCRMQSGHIDLFVATTSGELVTNSLAVHYLAHHRDEVPAAELAKVLTLTAPPLEPLLEELNRDLRPLPLPG